MSNQNNVLPFPTKMDSTLLEFRQVISKLLILEAQMMKMLDEVDNVEKECYILMERRDELLMDLERKDLIDTAMEVVHKQHDD
tara:strand:+ start:2873 stop:3121 length:249 start_codon:yes stop_codon:yes gene_type:complete